MGRRAERRLAIFGPPLAVVACVLGLQLLVDDGWSKPPPPDHDQLLHQARYRRWLAEEEQREQRRQAMLRPGELSHETFVRQIVQVYGEDYELAIADFLDDVTATYWRDMDPGEAPGARDRLTHVLLVRELVHQTYRDGTTLTNQYVIQNHPGSDRRSRIHKQVDGDHVALKDLKEGGEAADRVLRIPALFLTDLFSEQPAYRLLDGRGRLREAHTYGDCDEFEMAYVHLLAALGIEADVILPSSIRRLSHVRTRVQITGEPSPLWLEVDNTHSSVRTSATEPGVHEVPASHYDEAWVNARATEPLQIGVGREARLRLDGRLRRVLGFEP